LLLLLLVVVVVVVVVVIVVVRDICDLNKKKFARLELKFMVIYAGKHQMISLVLLQVFIT